MSKNHLASLQISFKFIKTPLSEYNCLPISTSKQLFFGNLNHIFLILDEKATHNFWTKFGNFGHSDIVTGESQSQGSYLLLSFVQSICES